MHHDAEGDRRERVPPEPGLSASDRLAYSAFVERLHRSMQRACERGDWQAWMSYATETGDARLWPEFVNCYREHPHTRWEALWHFRFYWDDHAGLVVPLLREALQDPHLRNHALETASHFPAMAEDTVHLLTSGAPHTWAGLSELLETLACQFEVIPSHWDFPGDDWSRDHPVVRQIAAELQHRYGIDLDRFIPVCEVRRKGSDEVLLRVDGDTLAGHLLNDIDLQGAGLTGARLSLTSFWGADLRDADLRGAALKGTVLTRSRLAGADLREADLSGADLAFADLTAADLRDAVLEGAELHGADLSRANLRGANLKSARLQNARLAETNLQDADLHDAILAEATLESVNLQGAQLSGAGLRDLLYDRDTRWPEGFEPQEHGAVGAE